MGVNAYMSFFFPFSFLRAWREKQLFFDIIFELTITPLALVLSFFPPSLFLTMHRLGETFRFRGRDNNSSSWKRHVILYLFFWLRQGVGSLVGAVKGG